MAEIVGRRRELQEVKEVQEVQEVQALEEVKEVSDESIVDRPSTDEEPKSADSPA